jgi:phenylacetate-coenzyme A ligase PaaK-like adenylate-forming protein
MIRINELTSKLDELVQELVTVYPFYQSLPLDRGKPLFEQLPIVDKQLIGRNLSLFERPGLGKVIETFTSGTTGVPFRCIKTPMERSMLSLVLYKHRKKWGLPAKHKMILLSERLLSDSKALEHYAALIRRDRPHMIQGRASALFALAQYFEEKSCEVPQELLFVQNWGEQVNLSQKQQVERVFGIPFVDYYGMEECWCIAFSNQQGELEVDQDSVYVQVIDSKTGQVLPHGEYGEVIVTSLLMRSLPFVRYRTGDIGRLIGHPEKGSLILQLLPVRSSQIRLSDRVLPAALFRYLDRLFWELSVVKGIRQFQMIQESFYSFRLLVVSDSDMSEDPVLKPKLIGFLRQCLASDIELAIENVSFIAPNPQSGKFQSFISLVS